MLLLHVRLDYSSILVLVLVILRTSATHRPRVGWHCIVNTIYHCSCQPHSRSGKAQPPALFGTPFTYVATLNIAQKQTSSKDAGHYCHRGSPSLSSLPYFVHTKYPRGSSFPKKQQYQPHFSPGKGTHRRHCRHISLIMAYKPAHVSPLTVSSLFAKYYSFRNQKARYDIPFVRRIDRV